MASQYITTGAVRFVQGDLWTGSDKGYQNKPLTDSQGRPMTQWFIGVAYPKGPEFDAFWGQVVAKAQLDFPGGEWQLPHPQFSWKMEDGDDAKHAGKDGFAGSWLLKLSSGFAPTVFDENNMQVVDHASVFKGCWLSVNVGVVGNGKPVGGNPGIFLNLGMVKRIGYGDRIASGPTAADVFANPVALPPGVSATPLAGPGMAQPMGAPGVGVQFSPPAPGQQPPAMLAPAPAYTAPLAPAPGVPVGPAAYGQTAAPGFPGGAPAPAAPLPAAPAQYAAQPAAQPAVAPMPGQPPAVAPYPPAAGPGFAAPAPGFLTPGQPQ